jgi:hypothetical protein
MSVLAQFTIAAFATAVFFALIRIAAALERIADDLHHLDTGWRGHP